MVLPGVRHPCNNHYSSSRVAQHCTALNSSPSLQSQNYWFWQRIMRWVVSKNWELSRITAFPAARPVRMLRFEFESRQWHYDSNSTTWRFESSCCSLLSSSCFELKLQDIWQLMLVVFNRFYNLGFYRLKVIDLTSISTWKFRVDNGNNYWI